MLRRYVPQTRSFDKRYLTPVKSIQKKSHGNKNIPSACCNVRFVPFGTSVGLEGICHIGFNS